MQSAHLLLSPAKIGRAGAQSRGGVAVATAPSPSSSRLTQFPEGVVEIVSTRSRRKKRRSAGESLGLFVVRNADHHQQQKKTGFGFKTSNRITTTSKSGPPLSGSATSSSSLLDARGAVRMMALTVKQEDAGAVVAPSWENLEEKLGLSSGSGSGAGNKFEAPQRLADAKERVFSPGEQPKLVFYRDSWSWCPYCEQVWLQLEEKKIPYRVEKIDLSCYGEKPQWFKDMVPSGSLPAVKLLPQEGKEAEEKLLLFDSEEIMFRLEEQFPDKNPLLPGSRDSPEFSKVEGLLKLERELVAGWISRLIQSDTSDDSDSSSSGAAFESAMDRVNSALLQSGGPYFLGAEFSLVDVIYAPFLERIAASMAYWLGVEVRGNERWLALDSWFDAMDSRTSYLAMKADDFSIVHNLESQLGPCNSSDAGLFQRALVDGTHGSWDLPLKPEATAWGWEGGTGRGGAREEAAHYLIANHEKLVEYVLRERDGALTTGENHKGAIDEGFRYVAEALLVGVQNVDVPEILPKEVGIAATLVKNQVAVPRDVSYPAARQLRAHLLWLTNHAGLGLRVAQAPQSSVNKDSGWNSWLYPGKDELPDDKEMTIFDHLEELRQRLTVSAGAVGVAILGCFFYSKELIRILEAPVYSQGVRFLQLSPGEFFFTTLKVSGYCGLLLGSPVILYEIIAFVLPGLTRSERRFLGPIVLGSSVLFYLGVFFSYIVLTPAALNFFVNYAEGAVESLWSIDQYFEFVLVLLFSTGLSFQVPVIQLLLGQTRLVSGDQMLSLWRYVVVGSVVVAAVLTPSTDPLTQILLAGPLMGLYFGGAFLVKYLVPPPESTT